MITTLIFDLDETLYPRNAGLMQEIGARILRYLIEQLGLSEEQARFQKQDYFQRYGTTLRGFIVERPDIDPEDYLHFVHDIDLTAYLGPNPALAEMLRSLPQRKVIFTNANVEHAQNVLKVLGCADQFECIIDVRAVDFVSKPDPRAYECILDIIGARGDECVLIEDNARNLRPAKTLGMTTILVDNSECEEVDYCVRNILDVRGAIEHAIARRQDGETAG
ncbi:MAG: pyrimidine 5'-nucleotidase [Chloroflexi bacterium]|nr:pyrimidine 5'-nucleotidase [Chloroflexota bacterium]